ncbi:MAG: PRC-barrel domain-containing protein [Candidatus Promineifilaceae bacterium]
MRPGKELIGKPIYSVVDGLHLGDVKDLYLDAGLERVTGIFLGQEGLFKRRALLIPLDKVAVLGVDAVLTSASDAVTDTNELVEAQKWVRREELQGRSVDTPGGTKVGAIGDVLLDEASSIVGFSLSRVHVTGPIEEKKSISKAAVVDTGSLDGAMTVDLARAELGDLAPRPSTGGPPADAAAETPPSLTEF